tara:strand:- start:4379 stop:5902 length:1524 start_codon:yes stop_codon:yes gene_type:complete
MIKSNFQLEKEKERSILDCITSITGKLNEATVVGFSAPMGGIANAQPSWATQRAKALTNPSLPLPLQPGQSTPFIARPPFVPQTQSSQQPQGSNRAQIARPSPDIVEPSADERYNQTMAGGNFSGASIADTAGMKERATERMGQASSGTSMPSYLPQTQNTPTADQRVRAAGQAQAVDSAKEINMTPQERDARRVAREAAEDRQEGETTATKVDDKTVYRQVGGEKERIHNRLQSQRDARNAREADRLRGEEEAQKNREKERDINRRRYSRPIYNQDSGDVTDSYTGLNIGNQRGNQSGGNMSSGRSGLGGGGGGGGGSSIPESFKGSLNRLDEIAAGISAIAGTELGKHIKKFAINAGSEAINFAKTQAPKIGYIALTPPRVLAAAATGRLSGLGYSKEGAIDTFNYYRNMIGGLGKAGGTLLTGLAGTAAGQKVGTAAGTAAGKVASWVGPLGIKVGKDVVGALDPAGHVDAFADEAALNTGAALWDPRMLSYNIKSKPLAQEKN